MKNLIIVISVCMLFSCNGSNSSQTSTASGSGDFTGFTMIDYPQGGVVKAEKKDTEGNIISEGEVINGKKEGIWIEYHTGRNVGIPKTISNYHKGNFNGPHMVFSENSSLLEKIYYANGVPHGKKYKYNYGKVLEDATFVNGNLDGDYKTFYKDGTPQQVSNYNNGVKEGKSTFYNEKGEVSWESEYVDGKPVEK